MLAQYLCSQYLTQAVSQLRMVKGQTLVPCFIFRGRGTPHHTTKKNLFFKNQYHYHNSSLFFLLPLYFIRFLLNKNSYSSTSRTTSRPPQFVSPIFATRKTKFSTSPSHVLQTTYIHFSLSQLKTDFCCLVVNTLQIPKL